LLKPTMRKRVEKLSFKGGVMRRFYLHTRYDGIFYAELVDPNSGLYGKQTSIKMMPCGLFRH